MAEQFEQAEQQVGRGRSRGKDRGKTSWRRAENTTPKELQAKRKRTAKTMPAAKKLRVASEKYEAKAKETERKELYANFTFLERRITQIYMYISHIHTHTDTHFFSFYFFFFGGSTHSGAEKWRQNNNNNLRGVEEVGQKW